MKVNFSKKIVLAAVAVLALLAVALFISQSSAPSTSVQVINVGYLPVVQTLPLFVAVEQGLFEKEGIRVELQRFDAPNQLIDSLVSGKTNAGAPSVAAGIATIVESKNPGALKLYSLTCGTLDSLNDQLLVAKNSSIQSIADLRGKKLGHIPGIQFSTVAKKILLENGVNPSEVTLVELAVSTQLATLSTGGVDALLTLEPINTIGTAQNVSRLLVASPMVKYVSNPWCGATGVVSTKFSNSNTEAAQKFVKVMREAVELTAKDAPSNRAYLVKYLSLPKPVAEKTPLPLFVSTKGLDAKTISAYQQFADLFYEMNVTSKKVDVKQMFWD
ncbi:ABC transporter substrate-binding protein [Candidatus Micrarchaeota archaeon]|nr:ABC transporter substrate-binding protein [Candidatus Micrarchaeota archaeon]